MDHERVSINASGISCGVLEVSRLDTDTEAVLYAIATRLYHPSRGTPAAFIIWSDIVPENFGNALADAVVAKNFGWVSRSAVMENPKTSNRIAVWTWAIMHERYKAWYADKRVERMKAVGA